MTGSGYETDDELIRKFGKPPPRYLYRYLPVSDPQRLSWAIDLIESRLLYLASVSDFNDPFDCLPTIKVPSPAALKIRLRRDRKRVMELGPKAVGDATLSRLLRAPPNSIRQFAEETFRATIGKIGISCFSERHDDIGMWSHYANSHRGVCVRFDTSLWPIGGPLTMLLPVGYTAERSPFHFPSHPRVKRVTEMFGVLTNKAEFWEGEKEWRLLVNEGAGNKVKVPDRLIDGVVFGARVDRSTVEVLEALRRPGLNFYRAEIDRTAFGLNFTTMND